MPDEIVDVVEEAEEEIFPPRPGGIVDRHRKRVAREKAEADAVENEGNPVEERAVRAVKTAVIAPEIIRAITHTIGPGQAGMVLPLNEYRARATVKVVTAGAQVLLSPDQGAALGGTGYPLAAADGPLPVGARGQLWAANTSDDVVQVAALSEVYAPEGATVPKGM